MKKFSFLYFQKSKIPEETRNQTKHYQILITGGGTAGITIAAQLKRKDSSLNIGLIEPSEKHYYQPAWTLVGAVAFDFKETERNEADYIPKGVKMDQG